MSRKTGNGPAAVREDETSVNQCSSQVDTRMSAAKAGVKGLEVERSPSQKNCKAQRALCAMDC